MPFVLYRWEDLDSVEPLRASWEEKDDLGRDCLQAVRELDDGIINRFLVVWEEPVD